MKRLFRFKSLSSRIIALVLALLAIFTVAMGATAYTVARRWLDEAVVSELRALAAAKEAAVETRLRKYMVTLNTFIQPEMRDDVAALMAAAEADRGPLRARLVARMRRSITVAETLEWAEITDREGRVIASTDSEKAGRLPLDPSLLAQGLARPLISDPVKLQDKDYLLILGPIDDNDGNPVAAAVLVFDAVRLFAITGDYTGLGETGETVLGKRMGDKIHFLSPLRFDPQLLNTPPVSMDGARGQPMIHAAAGQSGVIRALDYRGVPVIAAYRPIPEVGWGMVVKEDESEAAAACRDLRIMLLLGLGILLTLGAIVTVPLAYSVTRPLRDLEKATRRVAAGDLEAKVYVEHSDEVGRLADSFNVMVRRLNEVHADLERRNEELTSFAYVVSHDLRAPLRGINSLSEWIEEDLEGKLEEEQRTQMQLLRDRVQRMDALITGLLEYSRIGRVSQAPTMVNVEAMLRRVIASLEPQENMRIEITPPMPTLKTDELRLGQVFQNLIDNAVKHHPGPRGRIEIACREADGVPEFAVRDDGAGIEPRYHDRVFQVFQTLGGREESGSTGIGLALVKKIVEEHGGTVWVESNGVPGEGATFRFTWPRSEEKD